MCEKKSNTRNYPSQAFDGMFTSVNITFMRSTMNSFPVVVEVNLERCNSLYIIGSKPISVNASVQEVSRKYPASLTTY